MNGSTAPARDVGRLSSDRQFARQIEARLAKRKDFADLQEFFESEEGILYGPGIIDSR